MLHLGAVPTPGRSPFGPLAPAGWTPCRWGEPRTARASASRLARHGPPARGRNDTRRPGLPHGPKRWRYVARRRAPRDGDTPRPAGGHEPPSPPTGERRYPKRTYPLKTQHARKFFIRRPRDDDRGGRTPRARWPRAVPPGEPVAGVRCARARSVARVRRRAPCPARTRGRARPRPRRGVAPRCGAPMRRSGAAFGRGRVGACRSRGLARPELKEPQRSAVYLAWHVMRPNLSRAPRGPRFGVETVRTAAAWPRPARSGGGRSGGRAAGEGDSRRCAGWLVYSAPTWARSTRPCSRA